MLEHLRVINQVDGFNPDMLLEELADLETGDKVSFFRTRNQINWFRLKYPDGQILTEIVSAGDDNKPILMKATLLINGQVLAAAHAARQFKGGDSYEYECAETAAIGRALRHAGFGSQYDRSGEIAAAREVVSPSPAGAAVGGGSHEGDVLSDSSAGMTFDEAKSTPCGIPGKKNVTLAALAMTSGTSEIIRLAKETKDPRVKQACQIMLGRSDG